MRMEQDRNPGMTFLWQPTWKQWLWQPLSRYGLSLFPDMLCSQMLFAHSHKVYYGLALCSGCDCDCYVCFVNVKQVREACYIAVSCSIHFSSCTGRENVSSSVFVCSLCTRVQAQWTWACQSQSQHTSWWVPQHCDHILNLYMDILFENDFSKFFVSPHSEYQSMVNFIMTANWGFILVEGLEYTFSHSPLLDCCFNKASSWNFQ